VGRGGILVAAVLALGLAAIVGSGEAQLHGESSYHSSPPFFPPLFFFGTSHEIRVLRRLFFAWKSSSLSITSRRSLRGRPILYWPCCGAVRARGTQAARWSLRGGIFPLLLLSFPSLTSCRGGDVCRPSSAPQTAGREGRPPPSPPPRPGRRAREREAIPARRKCSLIETR